VKVGDLVVRTYGEGQRPTAIVVGMYPEVYDAHLVRLIWAGSSRIVDFGSEYLELVSESR
jgi:hypothetical protein